MKPPTLRVFAAAAAATLLSLSAAPAAPKKTQPPAPAPAVQKAPEPKKGFFSKVRNAIPFIRKKEASAPAPAPTAKPAAKSVAKKPAPAPAKLTEAKKPAAPAAKKAATAKTEAAPAEPKKPGFFKSLFTRSKPAKPAAPATGPKLAQAKAAKPAPSKVKDQPAAEAQPQKRGFLGFFKKHFTGPLEEDKAIAEVPGDQRIERPKDWSEYSVIREDEVALYQDSPSQISGPDARLSPGTLVKVKNKEKGWAVIETQGNDKRTGYIDALALRAAQETDFNDPPPPPVEMAAYSPLAPWAPLAPPPDLPDQPGKTDAADALLLLPPLELEPKP